MKNYMRLFTVGDQRMVALEGLRGVAAFLVVIHHYVNWLIEYTPPGSFQYMIYRIAGHLGSTGVQLFFVLSGFLIHFILMSRPSKYIIFMKRRLIRIVPLAWFCITVAIIVKAMRGPLQVPMIVGNKFADIVANYLLLPGVFPAKALYEVTWTLSYEMLFYALYPLLVMVYRFFGFSSSARVKFIFLFIPLIWLFSSYHFVVAYFIVGVFVAEALPYIKRNNRLASGINFAAIFYAIPVIIWLQFIAGGLAKYPVETNATNNMIQSFCYLAPAFFCLTASAVGPEKSLARSLSSTLFRFLGAISYSLYLTHIFVLGALMMLFHQFAPKMIYLTIFQYFSLMVIFSALAIGFASVTYLFIERPFSLDKNWPWETWTSLKTMPSKAQMQ